MKLLIVDDEELTRTGLISSIDWDSLGITEILQADDGVNGLEMARLYKPEIILCDVRMPRMTGIAMLERLEKFLPDSIPIFMSGYSDKEYLKAAIKLKAINYIEKPLHPEEVQAAVLEAQTLYKQKLRSHRGEAIHSQEIATRLAQQLTLPPSDNNKIADLCLELGQPKLLENGMNFTSVIVKLNESVEASGIFLEDLQNDISCFLEHYHLKCLFVEKRVQYLVHHIYGRNALSPTTLSAVGSYISRQYDTCGKHLIAAGNTVTDIFRVYQSYASAVILLQNCFFFPEKTFLTENSTIFMIKDYISRNYMNDTLSVKDISGHVYLSASYVCTFFKSETGQTLNQYLTEYRMEKAKQLLSDPKYKISEISSKVGYTDGNYFGKSFKKYSGFSPSEYREKMS